MPAIEVRLIALGVNAGQVNHRHNSIAGRFIRCGRFSSFPPALSIGFCLSHFSANILVRMSQKGRFMSGGNRRVFAEEWEKRI